VGYVGERTAVHKSRYALDRLDKVGVDGITEKCRHGSLCLYVVCRYGFAVIRVCHDYFAKACLEVLEAVRETEDRHDLGCHSNVKACFTRNAVCSPAKPYNYVAEGTVIHVHYPAPHYPARVYVELIALLKVIVYHCGEEVMCCSYRMYVACKVQVDRFHRKDL